MARMTPYRYLPLFSSAYRRVRRQLNALRFSGGGIWCPVCEGSFKRWLGDHERGACPYCLSACRHRLLCLLLARAYPPDHPPVETLFFAPDWGMEHWLRQRRQFRITTTDLSAPGVDFHSDITRLSCADHSYDLILCSHVLEHVPDDARAISEIFRALRPGGKALIQIPTNFESGSTDEDASVTDISERVRRFGQFDHVRLYGRDVAARLQAPGFQVETVRPMRQFDASEVRRLGLWDDTIFVCTKAC